MPSALAAVLTAACETMATLGIFPLRFDADRQGARILAVMRSNLLAERSIGPYSRENLPPEGLALAEMVSWRWYMKRERPGITIELGGMWPQVIVLLPDSGVEVLYVVPEEAPPGYQPEPGDVTAEIDLKLALEVVSRSVDIAEADLPITVTLTCPPDPDPGGILPVIPTLELDRRDCSARQRVAHNEALRVAAYSGQEFQTVGRTGISTRLGCVRIRDSQ